MAPHVVAACVHAEWEVQGQDLAAHREARRERLELLVGEPLGEGVVLGDRAVDVAGREAPLAQGSRPRVPVEAVALGGRAEPGVVRHVGPVSHEGVERGAGGGAGGAEPGEEGLEDAALLAQVALAVDVGVRGGGRDAGARLRLAGEATDPFAPERADHRVDVEPAIVPELPAQRDVGARLEPRRPEAREQGEGRDDRGAVWSREGRQLVEVGEVTAPPAALAVQREERRRDADGAPRVVEAAPGAVVGPHQEMGTRRTAGGPDPQPVVADRQLVGEPERHARPRRVRRADRDGPRRGVAALEDELALEGAVRGAHCRGDRARGGDALADDDDRFDEPRPGARDVVRQRRGGVALGAVHAERLEDREERVATRRALHAPMVEVRDDDAARDR